MVSLFGLSLIAVIIWMPIHIYNQHKVIKACGDAIQNANSQIFEINLEIDDAKDMAWGTYSDMGDAIDSLEGGFAVANPCEQ